MPMYAVGGGTTIWIVPPATLHLHRLVFSGTGSVGVYRYQPGAVLVGGSAPTDTPLTDGDRSSGCTLLVGSSGFSTGTAQVLLGLFDTVHGDVDFRRAGLPVTVAAGNGLWIQPQGGTVSTMAYYSV